MEHTNSKNSHEQFSDYEYVRKTLAFVTDNWRDQPSLGDMAREVGLSEGHLQRVFTRWAGISPKSFMQVLTIDHARELLRDSASILDTAYEVGLSGPGRLHDLFVSYEGMTPGTYKSRGAGLDIKYGFHFSPFGEVLIMAHGDRLVGLAFADEFGREKSLDDMKGRWPAATYIEDAAATKWLCDRVFKSEMWTKDQPLKVVFIGTDFEIRVWETLLRIPMGRATTYSDIADNIGKQGAARAVGSAVGRNPISFVVPCHRVLGKSGNLCGYHWGLTTKKTILGWEAGMTSH